MKDVSKYAEFAGRFLAEMEKKQCTGTEIAALLGITKQSVSNYTSGKSIPPIDKLHKLADYFDVTLDWLLCRPGAQRAANADMEYICRYTGLSEEAVLALHTHLAVTVDFAPILDLKKHRELSEKGVDALSHFIASTDAYEIFNGVEQCIDYFAEIKGLQDEAVNDFPEAEDEKDAYVGGIARKSQDLFIHAKLIRFEIGEKMCSFADDYIAKTLSGMGMKPFPACGAISTAFADKLLKDGGLNGEHNETQK